MCFAQALAANFQEGGVPIKVPVYIRDAVVHTCRSQQTNRSPISSRTSFPDTRWSKRDSWLLRPGEGSARRLGAAEDTHCGGSRYILELSAPSPGSKWSRPIRPSVSDAHYGFDFTGWTFPEGM